MHEKHRRLFPDLVYLQRWITGKVELRWWFLFRGIIETEIRITILVLEFLILLMSCTGRFNSTRAKSRVDTCSWNRYFTSQKSEQRVKTITELQPVLWMNEKVKGNFINETLMSAASKPFQAFSSLSRV